MTTPLTELLDLLDTSRVPRVSTHSRDGRLPPVACCSVPLMGMLVCDIDGTLSFDSVSVMPDIVGALVTVARTHQLVLASARPLRDMRPIVPAQLASAWLVGSNGALRKGPNGISTEHFDRETRVRLDAIIARFDLSALIDGEWDYSYTGDGTDTVISKVNRDAATNVARHELDVYTKAVVFRPPAAALAALLELRVEATTHTAEDAIDLSPWGIDKASGVAALTADVRDYVAFGNDANDAPLFARAARSYCVGDHTIGAKATRVIAPSEVAAALREAGEWMTREDADRSETRVRS